MDRVRQPAGAVAILGPVVPRVRAERRGVAAVQRGQPHETAGQRQVALARADQGQLGRDLVQMSQVIREHLAHVALEGDGRVPRGRSRFPGVVQRVARTPSHTQCVSHRDAGHDDHPWQRWTGILFTRAGTSGNVAH
jgi:hypothetical protein